MGGEMEWDGGKEALWQVWRCSACSGGKGRVEGSWRGWRQGVQRAGDLLTLMPML